MALRMGTDSQLVYEVAVSVGGTPARACLRFDFRSTGGAIGSLSFQGFSGTPLNESDPAGGAGFFEQRKDAATSRIIASNPSTGEWTVEFELDLDSGALTTISNFSTFTILDSPTLPVRRLK